MKFKTIITNLHRRGLIIKTGGYTVGLSFYYTSYSYPFSIQINALCWSLSDEEDLENLLNKLKNRDRKFFSLMILLSSLWDNSKKFYLEKLIRNGSDKMTLKILKTTYLSLTHKASVVEAEDHLRKMREAFKVLRNSFPNDKEINRYLQKFDELEINFLARQLSNK